VLGDQENAGCVQRRELLRKDTEKEKVLTQSVSKIRTEHTALDQRIKTYERELESPGPQHRADALRAPLFPDSVIAGTEWRSG